MVLYPSFLLSMWQTSDGSHDGSSSPSPRKVTKVGDSAFVTDAGGRLHGPVPIEEDTNKAGGDGAMFDRAQSRSPSLSRQRRRKSAAKKDTQQNEVAGFPATKDQDMAFSDGDDINSGEDYDQSHLESPGSQKRRIKRRIAEKARKVAEREEHRRHRRRRDRERRLRRREERMGIKSGRDGSEDSSEDSFGSPPRRHRDSNRLASPYSTPPSSPHRRSTKKKSKREDRGRHRSSSKYTRLSNSPSPRAERNRKAATYRESLRQARKSIHRQSPSPPLKTGNQRRKQSKSGGSAEKENGENGEEKKKEAFRHRRSANDVKINITRGFLNKKSGRWVTLDDSRFLSIGRETISYNAVMFEMNFQFRTLEEDASYGLVLCTRSGQRIRDGTALSDPAYWEGAGHHAAIRVHPCVSEEDMSRKEARLAKRQELLGACSEGEEPTLPAPVSSMPEADGDQEEGEHGGGEHGGGEHGGGEHGEAAESPEAPEAPPPPPRPQAFYIDCEHLRCRVCLQMAVEPVLCRVTGDISGCRTCITRLRRNARNNRCPRCQDPDCYGTRLTIVKGLDKLCREGRALESEVAERFNHESAALNAEGIQAGFSDSRRRLSAPGDLNVTASTPPLSPPPPLEDMEAATGEEVPESPLVSMFEPPLAAELPDISDDILSPSLAGRADINVNDGNILLSPPLRRSHRLNHSQAGRLPSQRQQHQGVSGSRNLAPTAGPYSATGLSGVEDGTHGRVGRGRLPSPSHPYDAETDDAVTASMNVDSDLEDVNSIPDLNLE